MKKFLFRKRSSGPPPLYETPLKYIWPCFFLYDIIMLYIMVFAFFILIVCRIRCVEIFPMVAYSFINLVSIFFIDFVNILVKEKEIVNEDEILYSIIFTTVSCLTKICINGLSFYMILSNLTFLLKSEDAEIAKRCHYGLEETFLFIFTILSTLPWGGTYFWATTTFSSIVDFNKQIQKYEVIA